MCSGPAWTAGWLARSLVANLHAAQAYRSSGLQTFAESRAWVIGAVELILGCSLPHPESIDLSHGSVDLSVRSSAAAELESRC